MVDLKESALMKRKLAIIVSHPIQHFAALYRALASVADIDLCVFYASRIGLSEYFDKEMNVQISWQTDLLSGYNNIFLENADNIKSVSFESINSTDLSEQLDIFDPDVIMTYGYYQINALRAMWWARRRRRRIIMISDSELLSTRSSIRSRLKDLIVPLLFRYVDAFLSVGDCNEKYYQHYGVKIESIFRSPFTIDEPTFEKAFASREASRASLRSELNLDAHALVALFVGKLSTRKRPFDLVAAVKELHDQGEPSVHAVFVGDGPLLKELREQAEKIGAPAHFLGFINVDRLPYYYAGADLLAHPSEADPHPLVCSEAACVGLPMVLSDRVGALGPSDIARAGENAVVFPCGDTTALARSIASLCSDPEKLARMSARSREIFSDCDVRHSVSGIVRALKYVTSNRPDGG
jgi:glycosyltransferase involved in cell wall biosynthesis